ncbi:MAG TPA: hypothetical protein VFG54_04275, partial [Prolixibacteraceae bacterium]|nr:hypothetical protein [Prolixibacteraceae bacterium]
MEGFTYHNIFETKGFEYLAIVVFFIILIPFWKILNRKASVARQAEKSLGTLTARTLQIPQGLFFSRYHTWAHLERSGVAKVGLDDLLIHLTGEVTVNQVKASGEKIKKGDLLAEISHKGKPLK